MLADIDLFHVDVAVVEGVSVKSRSWPPFT